MMKISDKVKAGRTDKLIEMKEGNPDKKTMTI